MLGDCGSDSWPLADLATTVEAMLPVDLADNGDCVGDAGPD